MVGRLKGVNGLFNQKWRVDGEYDWVAVEQDLQAAQQAHITWTRAIVAYEDYDNFDRFLSLARRYDINIVFRFAKGPPEKDLGDDAAQARDSAALREAVRRFGDTVKYWEIGNEPNIQKFWDVQDSARGVRRYTRFLKNSYEAVKSVDPQAQVLVGGIAEKDAEQYIEQLVATQAYRYFDILSIHPYAATPEKVLSRLASIEAAIEANPELANKPIWITEIGFHTEQNWTGLPGKLGDEQTKAQYLVETMQKIWHHGVRTPVFWYTYQELTHRKGFGLVQRDPAFPSSINTLPAYHALRDLR